MANSGRGVYGTLDGMRGVAAIAVVMMHAADIMHVPALFGPVRAPNAALAVDLFFAMSGFIIAHAYEAKMLVSLSAARFVTLRIVRLYPLYLLGLALGLVEALAEFGFGGSQGWTATQILVSMAAGLLMLPTPPGILEGAAPVFRLNPPAWSLFFEVAVNLLYGLLVARLTNRVLGAIVAVSALALVGTAVYVGNLNVGYYWNNLWGGIPRVMFSFSAGVLIFRLRERLCVLNAPPVLILVAAAVVFAINAGAWNSLYTLACTLLVLPGLVILGATVEPGPRLRPAFKFLGVTSYAIYSLHFPLLLAAPGVARRFSDDDVAACIPWIPVALLGLFLVVCLIVSNTFDMPLRRRLLRGSGAPPLGGASPAQELKRLRR